MSRGARRIALWALALGYLGANYLVIERAPAIWHAIVAAIPGDGTYAMIGLYAVVGGVAVGHVVRARHGSMRRHVVSVGLVAAFAAMYVAERYPGEKFHMFQYGVFGLLLFGALRVDLDPRGTALYAVGVSIGAVAGLVDELIQHLLPNRVFTPHDVVVNGASAALVLVFLRVHLRPAETLEREIS